MNYISWSNSIYISLTTLHLHDLQTTKARIPLQESFLYIWMYKSGCKTFAVFLGKYRLKTVKLKDCKIKQESSKTFQKRNYRIRKCFNIGNLVNIRVAEIIKYQSHRGSNHLLSVKNIKIEKGKGACHIKLFQPVQLVHFNI